MFFVKDVFRRISRKVVILSGAHHRFIASRIAFGAQSKDPGSAYLADAAGGFSTTTV
jgi:hypothetical protein